MENYGEMSILQLKDQLRLRNGKLSGRKKDLVERYAICFETGA
jgi:hypothetical protein